MSIHPSIHSFIHSFSMTIHSFIAGSLILARVAFIALGETVRIIGSLLLMCIDKPGMPAETTTKTKRVPIVLSSIEPAAPYIHRSPLGRDPLTGALV